MEIWLTYVIRYRLCGLHQGNYHNALKSLKKWEFIKVERRNATISYSKTHFFTKEYLNQLSKDFQNIAEILEKNTQNTLKIDIFQ